MKLILLILAVLFVTGAGCQTRPDLPPAGTECSVGTAVQSVDKVVHKPIDAEFTARVVDPKPGEPATWGLCCDAAERREALLQACNDKLQEIEGLQGREAK